jgi:hypothetical protein
MLSTFMMLRINGRGGDLADNHLAVVDAVLRTRRAAKDKYLKSVNQRGSFRQKVGSRPFLTESTP